jgi:hypothetical protein
MCEFRDIIGKSLKAVSFMTSFEGYEDYSSDERVDFDYLPLGGLTILFEDNSVYCIADYFSTSLGTPGVGIKKLDEFKPWPNSKADLEKWAALTAKSLKSIKLYWNKENWSNGMTNEWYPESAELIFDNYSIFYFCGDVDEFDIKENRYAFVAGRASGIILYNVESFKKYYLDQVQRVEVISLTTK